MDIKLKHKFVTKSILSSKLQTSKLAIFIIVIIFGSLLVSNKAEADFINNFQGYPWFWSTQRDPNLFANCNGRDHAQANWLSKTNNTADDGRLTLASDAKIAQVRINTGGAVCNQNLFFGSAIRKNLKLTGTYAFGARTNKNGISIKRVSQDDFYIIDYNQVNQSANPPNNNSRYTSIGGIVYEISGLETLPSGNHDIKISIDTRKWNNFNPGGNVCVATDLSGEYSIGNVILEITRCQLLTNEYTFSIYKPPPSATEYKGQIQIQKRDATTGTPLSNNATILNSKTFITQNNGAGLNCGPGLTNVGCQNVGLNLWNTGQVMFVNPTNLNSNVQGTYKSKIDVPAGFRVKEVKLSRPNNLGANAPNLNCTQPNNTGTCSADTKVWDKDTTFVDWILENTIQTSLDDVCDTRFAAQSDVFFQDRGFTSKADASTKAWGWAYDGSVGAGNSTVRIYYNKDVPNKAQAFEDVIANSSRPDINRARGIPQGVGFRAEVPLRFFDGNQHTASAFLLKGNTEIPLTDSPITFTCPKYFAPFLQTTQGNVISSGKISGQIRGLPGSIDPSLSEAEFLVVSLAGGGSPFCSQYKYVIGNPNSQDSNINERCKNGKYNASVPNIGSGDKFAIYEVLSSVYANQAVDQSVCQKEGDKQIGRADNNNKLPDKDGTVVKLGTNCEEGLIYKIEGNLQIDRTLLTGGRVTIIVKGDVTIADQITADTAPRSNPKLVPSLAIVSTGNINIKPIGGGDSVDMNVLANLYSGGKIRTCAENSKLLDVNQCRQRLFIFGSVVSSLQSDFNRTFFQETSADKKPAELIKFNPLYISAGIEDRWFRESSSNNSSFKVEDEIEELPPEF